MKRKSFNVLLWMLCLVISGLVVSSCSKDDYDDTEVRGLISSLDSKVATANSAIETLKAQLPAIEQAYKDADAKLQAAITAADGKATEALQQAQANLAAINALKAQTEGAIRDLQTAVNQHTTDINAFNDKLAAANARIDAAYVLINGLDEKINVEIASVRTDLNKVSGDITELQTRMGAAEARLTTLEAAVDALGIDLGGKIEALRTELLEGHINGIEAKIGEIETALVGINAHLSKLFESLDALITGLYYEKQDIPVLHYNEYVGNDPFIFGQGLSGAVNVKKGDMFITKNGGYLYATINPAEVDFSSTTLSLVNSLNENHPIVTLGELMPSTKKLTRAQMATGNGFYQMSVKTKGQYPKGTVINPLSNGKEVLYALQNTYKSYNADGEEVKKTITGNYKITLSLEKVAPCREFTFTGYYEKACQNIWDDNQVLGTKEFGYEPDATTFDSYMRANLKSDSVYAFYIEYDKDFFAEAPEVKVYEGAAVDSAFKFSCKAENLAKPTTITYHILNYDGTVAEWSQKVSYARQLLKSVTLTPTVVPGAKANAYNGQSGFAFIDLTNDLKGKFSAADLEVYKTKSVKFNLNPEYRPAIYPTITCTATPKLEAIYDPALIKLGTSNDNNFKITVLDNEDHKVTVITVKVTVEKPNHLDSYIKNGNRIPAAFGFKGTKVPGVDFDENMIIAWAQSNDASLTYMLDGAFNMLNENEVPNATVAGKFGWTKSNDSRFFFTCTNDQNPPVAVVTNAVRAYSIKVPNADITAYGKVTSLHNDKKFAMTQDIDYYNLNRKYVSDAKDNFTIRFVSPINYGIAAASNMWKTTVDCGVVPKMGISKVLDFHFTDYSLSTTKEFYLNDSRIKSISVVLDKSNPNYGLMKNFVWTEATRTITFDYTSTSLNKDTEVDAVMEVEDIWGVKSVINVKFYLQSSQAAKAE